MKPTVLYPISIASLVLFLMGLGAYNYSIVNEMHHNLNDIDYLDTISCEDVNVVDFFVLPSEYRKQMYKDVDNALNYLGCNS